MPQPGRMDGIRKMLMEGALDPKHIDTSYIERRKLTVGMHVSRFTRSQAALSKRFVITCTVALHTVCCWIRVHETLRVAVAVSPGEIEKLLGAT